MRQGFRLCRPGSAFPHIHRFRPHHCIVPVDKANTSVCHCSRWKDICPANMCWHRRLPNWQTVDTFRARTPRTLLHRLLWRTCPGCSHYTIGWCSRHLISASPRRMCCAYRPPFQPRLGTFRHCTQNTHLFPSPLRRCPRDTWNKLSCLRRLQTAQPHTASTPGSAKKDSKRRSPPHMCFQCMRLCRFPFDTCPHYIPGSWVFRILLGICPQGKPHTQSCPPRPDNAQPRKGSTQTSPCPLHIVRRRIGSTMSGQSLLRTAPPGTKCRPEQQLRYSTCTFRPRKCWQCTRTFRSLFDRFLSCNRGMSFCRSPPGMYPPHSLSTSSSRSQADTYPPHTQDMSPSRSLPGMYPPHNLGKSSFRPRAGNDRLNREYMSIPGNTCQVGN